ncbi:bifunctional metallophosphatase/5'-nucleotidase [Aquimarina sp. BL5]|uniref:bifunctional metallophosphatase/5'-nucleotidase n=1 Tax=Aquimarina sp. BL5 TaxID=1714860 RepID=UPI000E4CBCE2|nr:metallophosphatase [Aquimarina sp. BL5]AXT51150.1 bifunctional metallophosphatase/5'-nucleotidase [Aquimarina sp. BL5]RKM94738.1 bifunctional metallophosphatase/5'-nucleotidase [Aquimarina sp. BL5]
MKRREFVKHTALTTGLMTIGGVGLTSFSASQAKKITILHTNDVHSHIDPFGPEEGRNSNKGGVARRATIIESIRKENPNTLLLDAGDIFQGTPYFNFYGGELEFKLMSMLKYDVATIGNHDFDNGIEGLHAQMPYAGFKFVSANYDFSNTVMDTFVKPYEIIIKDTIKIGIFGLGVALEGLVMKDLYKETKYLNPIDIAQDMSAKLKNEEKCDLVICLSHLGYDYKNEPNKVSDLSLAKATENIDLIIGGHTHTFLKEPTVVKNRKDKDVLVNQVGCYGLYLGRIDFYFDSEKSKVSKASTITV